MIYWMIRHGDVVFFTWQEDREAAKRRARSFLLGNPDKYVCEPLTGRGQMVRIDGVTFSGA